VVQPLFVFCENVGNLFVSGFEEVVRDLRNLGYGVEAEMFSAREVGAPHNRERVYILGYAKGGGAGGLAVAGGEEQAGEPRRDVGEADVREGVTAARLPLFPPGRKALEAWGAILGERVEAEPIISRMADELAPWVDGYEEGHEGRFYALGNGVVPAVAGYAFVVLLARMLGGAVRP
jgi:DNA (cytosine-5)-methyltransferase 1